MNMFDRKIIGRKKRQIRLSTAQIAVAMAGLTFIAKLLGFIREIFIAHYYGAGKVIDAFVMAQDIPDTIFAAFIQFVGTSFLPIYSKKDIQDSTDASNRFVSQAYNFLLILSILVLIICLVGAEQLVGLFAPGFLAETSALCAFYLRISAFLLIGNVSVTIFEPYLRYKGHYLAPVLFGFSQSISIILFTFISVKISPNILIFGVVVGYLVRGVGLQIMSKKKGFVYIADFKLSAPVREMFALSFPILLGSFAGRFNSFIDRMLASGFPEGSVSSLSYAHLIINFISIFSYTIISTIIYPKINRAAANNNNRRLSDLAENGFSLSLVVIIPLAFASMAFSRPIIQLIYERGAFGILATELTAQVFSYYAVGLPFSAVCVFVAQIFYSLHDTRSPVYCSMVSVGANIVLNFVMTRFMGVGGLALATSISSIIHAVLLCLFIKKKYPQIRATCQNGKIILITAFSIGSVFTGRVLYKILGIIHVPNFFSLFIVTGIAVGMYLLFMRLARMNEYRTIIGLFKFPGKVDKGG